LIRANNAEGILTTAVGCGNRREKTGRANKMRNTKIAMAAAAALMAWGLVAAGCAMDDGEPGGNSGTADVVNITFGEISASSTQEQVTGTIRSSLELLQAQTQNIINKLTEYKATLQQKYNSTQITVERDKILAKIDVVTNMIEYENKIKSAQQNRNTGTGINYMDTYYGGVLDEAAKLFDNPIDGQVFSTKMSIYSGTVELDERDIIDSNEKHIKLDIFKKSIYQIETLEASNGHAGYRLPSPETNMYGLRLQLKNESKQAFCSDEILGEYGQYIFYQGEDMAEYFALAGDARAAGKEINLP
jgi:hypothetical protein